MTLTITVATIAFILLVACFRVSYVELSREEEDEITEEIEVVFNPGKTNAWVYEADEEITEKDDPWMTAAAWRTIEKDFDLD